jgi:triacylglycerol esterase/lipase EstA (alpha/beta hydrolase family)
MILEVSVLNERCLYLTMPQPPDRRSVLTKRQWTIRKVFRLTWAILGLLFVSWLVYSYQAHGVSDDLLKSGKTVAVDDSTHYYRFTPAQPFKQVLIFYPGAMVDAKAYVPLCRQLAQHNVMVYLIKMPWRLASKGYRKPIELRLLADKAHEYILVGHSQGAKMAAQFVYENPGTINKLVLIGSTHPRDISLADAAIPVLKIYGSKDGVADPQAVLQNRGKLPKTSRFVKIEGANHSQFGYYGFQFGDQSATITREQQQAATLKSILSFIDR